MSELRQALREASEALDEAGCQVEASRAREAAVSGTDGWSDPNMNRWVDTVLRDTLPKLSGSIATIQLVPDGEGDVKFWVELGASIMLEKPIIAVITDGRSLPPKLAAIADEVVEMPEGVSPESSRSIADAVERVVSGLDGGNG